jgi:hypothetical protein
MILGVVVPFSEAKVGQSSYVYSETDGTLIYGEWSFVTDLDWFEDRDDEVRLKRQHWLLVEEDELVLPDPYRLVEGEGE